MWSLMVFVLGAKLAVIARGDQRKDERVSVEVYDRRNTLKRTLNCSSQITFEADDHKKTLKFSLPTRSPSESDEHCIAVLRRYTTKPYVLLKYGHQISYEVIVKRCNLTQLSASSADKEGKKIHYMTFALRCQEKSRPKHHCFVEYLFAVIFVCAVAGTFFTVFIQFCRDDAKQYQAVSTDPTNGASNQNPDNNANPAAASGPSGKD